MQRAAFFIAAAAVAATTHAASDLLVCSLLSDQVLRFDGTTGAFIGVFANTHIDGPEGITIGPDGNVYVASEYSANVTKWSPTGTYLGEFVPPSGGWEDLQFGPDGNLYTIAHFGTPEGPLSKWDGTTGAYLGQWGAGAAVSHQHGLTFGPDGNPYFGHEIFGPVGSVGKIDQSTGGYAGNVATDPRIDGIFDLVIKDGIIYTDDFFTGAVHKFNSTSGAFLGDFISGTSDAVSWGMVFHSDGFFYVSGGGHVWRYDSATGAFHDTFATGISGAAGIAFVEVVPEPFTITAFAFALPLFWRRRRQR